MTADIFDHLALSSVFGQAEMQGNNGFKAGHPNPPSTNVWIGDLPPEITQEQLVQIFQQYGVIKSANLSPPKAGKKASGHIRFDRQEEATFVVDTLHGNIPMGLTEAVVCNYANERKKGGKGSEKGAGGGAWDIISQVAQPMGSSAQTGNGYRSHPYSSADRGGYGKSGYSGAGMGGGKSRSDHMYLAVKNLGILGAGRPPPACEVYVGNIPDDATDLFLFQLFSPFGAIAHTGVRVMTNPDGSCKGFGFVDFVDPNAAAGAVTALDGLQLLGEKPLVVSRKSEYMLSKNSAKFSGSPIGSFGDEFASVAANSDAEVADFNLEASPDFNAVASMLLGNG